MSDAVSICNMAAVMLGAGVIQSLEDDTDLSRMFANLYEPKKLSIMSRYPWNFLRQKFYLTRSADNPIQGYKYSYIIPGDALAGAPHAVFYYNDQRIGTADFRVVGKRIYCDYPELWGEFTVDRKESELPQYFQELLAHAIAADLAFAITDQQSVADYHRTLAFGTPSEGGNGGMMGQAMTTDSQNSGMVSIDADHFVNARMGAW